MPSQLLTKRRVKRRQQRLRLVSKNAKRKVRSVRKHRKTAKKVMRGGWGKKKIYYGILCDSIPMIMDSESLPGRGIELEYILPIFIIVMYGDDLFLFFNKNITSEEITKILKSILGINQVEVTLTLDPPIELPAVSGDAPEYKGTQISNINDIEKIYNWSLSNDEDADSPSKVLLEYTFRAYVDPFQHIISKRFIMLKGKGVGVWKTFENDIYSGEVNDTIPLDEIKVKSLTKHTFTSPTPDVVTERFKSLMRDVNNEKHYKLQKHVHTLEQVWDNPPQKGLYKEYIPPDKDIELSLYYSDPKLTTTPEKEWIKISNTLSGKRRRFLYGDVDSDSDLIPKNVLNSINKDTETTWGRTPGSSYPGLGGLFIPFPQGWFHPPQSSTTTTTSATSVPSAP